MKELLVLMQLISLVPAFLIIVFNGSWLLLGLFNRYIRNKSSAKVTEKIKENAKIDHVIIPIINICLVLLYSFSLGDLIFSELYSVLVDKGSFSEGSAFFILVYLAMNYYMYTYVFKVAARSINKDSIFDLSVNYVFLTFLEKPLFYRPNQGKSKVARESQSIKKQFYGTSLEVGKKDNTISSAIVNIDNLYQIDFRNGKSEVGWVWIKIGTVVNHNMFPGGLELLTSNVLHFMPIDSKTLHYKEIRTAEIISILCVGQKNRPSLESMDNDLFKIEGPSKLTSVKDWELSVPMLLSHYKLVEKKSLGAPVENKIDTAMAKLEGYDTIKFSRMGVYKLILHVPVKGGSILKKEINLEITDKGD
ncbi:hypothetical protein [Carnobacterium maltaromaticum]|uniref:hypothetical protein n=1 Tax=Carnobacterium maltaromaticum TaxID=2751 RepID=UPI001D4CC86C|nr:hypothetical protein [Carnobacterium maltaromaticum]MCC4313462.1 hypothetical protein [Carnobacterium maltaromaticum]